MFRFTLTSIFAAVAVTATLAASASAQQQQSRPVFASVQKFSPQGYLVRAEVVKATPRAAKPGQTAPEVISQIQFEVSPITADGVGSGEELVKATGSEGVKVEPKAVPTVNLTVSDDTGALYAVRDFFFPTDNIAAPGVEKTVPTGQSAQAVLELVDPSGKSRLKPNAKRIVLNIDTSTSQQKLTFKLPVARK